MTYEKYGLLHFLSFMMNEQNNTKMCEGSIIIR